MENGDLALQRHVKSLLDQVLDGIEILYHRGSPGCDEATAMLSRVVQRIRQLDKDQLSVVPSSVPGCVHLDTVFDEGGYDPLIGRLLGGIRALSPYLRWQRNPNYNEQNVGERYYNNYGYCNLVGENGFVEATGVALGFFLMGRNLHYPAHYHPAAELYHVLSGRANWSQDHGPWAKRNPGSVIYHRSNENHSMQTNAETLFALYCWEGDETVSAQLTTATH